MTVFSPTMFITFLILIVGQASLVSSEHGILTPELEASPESNSKTSYSDSTKSLYPVPHDNHSTFRKLDFTEILALPASCFTDNCTKSLSHLAFRQFFNACYALFTFNDYLIHKQSINIDWPVLLIPWFSYISSNLQTVRRRYYGVDLSNKNVTLVPML